MSGNTKVKGKAIRAWSDQITRYGQFRRPELGFDVPLAEACGDTLVWATDLSDSAELEGQLLQRLRVEAAWNRGGLEGLERAREVSIAGSHRWSEDSKRWDEQRARKRAEAEKKAVDANTNRPEF